MRTPIAIALMLAPLLAPSRALAQAASADNPPERDDGLVVVRAEVGGGYVLPEYQRNTLGYEYVVAGALRPALRVAGPLLVQASLEAWFAPSPRGLGAEYTAGGGLRLEPRLGARARLVLDANAALAITGGDPRFAFGGGVGLDVLAHPMFSVGPYVRYAHTLASPQDFPSDAIVVAGGVAFALRSLGAERARPALDDARTRDRDGDGVPDADDLCGALPAGARPDPQRAGCPLADGDGDGIPDRDDVCPSEAAGDRPDPARAGCAALDTDGDGVPDHADACPTAPPGEHPDPRRAGCPDGDDDGDGVRNALDACRDRHQGVHPDPARAGCALPDRDNDSVPDANDHCPDQVGAPHPDPNRNGCPGLVRIEGHQIVILRPVFFAPTRDRILPRSRPVLQAVADAMRASPDIRRLAIHGHTDDNGDPQRNQELSRRRANNVMAWLIQSGVEPARLEAHGFGQSRPLIQDTTEDARAVNRRVEFHVVDRVGAPGEARP